MIEPDNFKDPIFKGCTRPAMYFGVPIYVIVPVGGIIGLISVYTNFLILFSLIPITLFLRAVAKVDDQIYRLLWLKWKCRRKNKNFKFWGASAYSPLSYKKRNRG